MSTLYSSRALLHTHTLTHWHTHTYTRRHTRTIDNVLWFSHLESRPPFSLHRTVAMVDRHSAADRLIFLQLHLDCTVRVQSSRLQLAFFNSFICYFLNDRFSCVQTVNRRLGLCRSHSKISAPVEFYQFNDLVFSKWQIRLFPNGQSTTETALGIQKLPIGFQDFQTIGIGLWT